MKRSVNANRSAPNAGEPLLTCFDCQRTRTLEQLTLFPWWDERVNEFEVMYRCESCLRRAHKKVLKQLTKNEQMLTSFVDFARTRVVLRQLTAPPTPQGPEALEYARQVLDKLAAHEVFVQRR
jgi:hypothetical protein